MIQPPVPAWSESEFLSAMRHRKAAATMRVAILDYLGVADPKRMEAAERRAFKALRAAEEQYANNPDRFS